MAGRNSVQRPDSGQAEDRLGVLVLGQAVLDALVQLLDPLAQRQHVGGQGGDHLRGQLLAGKRAVLRLGGVDSRGGTAAAAPRTLRSRSHASRRSTPMSRSAGGVWYPVSSTSGLVRSAPVPAPAQGKARPVRAGAG